MRLAFLLRDHSRIVPDMGILLTRDGDLAWLYARSDGSGAIVVDWRALRDLQRGS
jgi:hypothetical protein